MCWPIPGQCTGIYLGCYWTPGDKLGLIWRGRHQPLSWWDWDSEHDHVVWQNSGLLFHSWAAAAPLWHGQGLEFYLMTWQGSPRLIIFRTELQPVSWSSAEDQLPCETSHREELKQESAEGLSNHHHSLLQRQPKAAFLPSNSEPIVTSPHWPKIVRQLNLGCEALHSHLTSPVRLALSMPQMHWMLPPTIAPYNLSFFPSCPPSELADTSSQMPSWRMMVPPPCPDCFYHCIW